ncbi:MAG: sigma-70 family RNA polymerase sigma factor [Actinomycetota bacterium]|nr:sigma-70 family RNA polymerase sigma factor [Actinomycetota bacterium]MDQ3351266.1 sigma-70 family RNA polymerase sigma factor [Actinomycetota bacterium]
MDRSDALASRFEQHRDQLRAVARRMLGNTAEADDAVQETWLRLDRSDAATIDNLGGWLTTVVSRVSLDVLRTRASRRETSPLAAEPSATNLGAPPIDVEGEAIQADAVGAALLVVLDTLSPAERLAFVLHDLFAVPFEEIAPIVGRTPEATRQLASRARRRVRGGGVAQPDRRRQREVVEAFLAASRNGEFDRLLELLDPDVVLRADRAAVDFATASAAHGAPLLARQLRGAQAVASTFSGRATVARVALIDGNVGAVYAPGGTVRSAFQITVSDGKIVAIDIIADPTTLATLDVLID